MVSPDTSCSMGVGNGGGKLFVYGDIDSIMAAQNIVMERLRLKRENQDLRSRLKAAVEILSAIKKDRLGADDAIAIRVALDVLRGN